MLDVLLVMSLAALCLSAALSWWIVRDMPRERLLACALYPLSQIALMLFAMLASMTYGMGDAYSVVALVGGVACAVSNPLLFRSLARAERRDLDRMRIRVLESQLGYQRRHLERVARSEGEALRMRGEVAARLGAVAGALEAGDVEGARRLLGDAAAAVRPEVGRYSSNPAVDALLEAKASECEAAGVDLEASVQVPDGCEISDVELCAVLSNAIDNALEACLLVGEGGRWVRVDVRVRAGLLVLEVRNPYAESRAAERPAPGEGPVPEHGWGLGIMDTIARRHSGELVCERDGGVWRTRVIMGLS